MELSKQAQVALKAANEASGTLLKYFRNIEAIDEKGGNPQDVVTEADFAVERQIIALIQQHFPSHNILAEETGFIDKKSKFTWVIDPLDGTGNFAAGLPFFAISIALLKGKQPVVAAISAPVEGELFYAQKGKGAFLTSGDGKPFKIKVSKTDTLAQAFGIIEAGHNNAVLLKALNILGPQIKRFRVLGSTVLNLASVAAGRVDFFTVARINTHDIAGGMLLVSEASGTITISEPLSLDTEKKVTLTASNGVFHKEILQAIKTFSY